MLAKLKELEATLEAEDDIEETDDGSCPAELADLDRLEMEDWACLLALLKLD